MSELAADLQECVSSGSTLGGSKTSAEPSSEISSLSFLQDAPAPKKSASHTAAHKRPAKPATGVGKGFSKNGKLAIVGGSLFAAILLVGVIIMLRSKDDTLVVEIDQPNLASTDSDRKTITTFQTPAFKRWEKQVAAMPAEEQAKAVKKKLMELNPGFDGKAKHEVEDGVVSKFYFL